MKNSLIETVVGAVVIAIAAVFFFFVYRTSGGPTTGGYRIAAEFDNIGAINVGTDVRLAGIKIGTVQSQALNPENYQARIVMAIDPKVKLSDDTTAKVTSEGLLGASFIALEPGGSETFLKDGAEITVTQGAIDFWKLVNDAIFANAGSKDTQ
jgi:phospholipid/cholesterol/gamma-HCH transport system substrate-binding protein